MIFRRCGHERAAARLARSAAVLVVIAAVVLWSTAPAGAPAAPDGSPMAPARGPGPVERSLGTPALTLADAGVAQSSAGAVAPLSCAEIDARAAGGVLGWTEAHVLLASVPGCELSTYARLVSLLDEKPLDCFDVNWHAERGLISLLQASWLHGALALRGRPCPLWAPPDQHVHFGTSVEGRPLLAVRRAGSLHPLRRVVAVGVIHGEEPGGRAVTDRLLSVPVPADLELWVIPTVNPDGERVGRRGNTRGVDLNRNFPTGWLPPGSHPFTSGGYYSGAGPASEPEVQAVMELLRAVRPSLTLWYHQPWGVVICDLEAAGPVCPTYAARVGLEVTRADRPGSAIAWQAAEGLGAALVVELHDGPPPPAVVERHALAAITP